VRRWWALRKPRNAVVRTFISRPFPFELETRQPRSAPRFQRHPADILITTAESLYLLLTLNARDSLRAVEVVVIDEIHAIVPTKRGSHLALSIEPLQHLVGRPLQRIGLSAAQRPLEAVPRFLGGAEPSCRESNSLNGYVCEDSDDNKHYVGFDTTPRSQWN